MKITDRDKKILLLGGGALLIAALYQWVLTPVLTSQAMVREKLAGKEILLAKTNAKIARKGRLTAKTKVIEEEIARAEKGLLHGKTPSLAAAELQRLLKKIAARGKVKVRSEKIISPIVVGEYQRIPVRVTLKGLVTNLKKVLHQIESNPMIMPISEARIKVINTRNPSQVEATLTVAGIIKKAANEGN